MGTYQIDEGDHTRQRLLARHLDPLTEPLLRRAAPDPEGRWLDLGCGRGETTALLRRHLQPAGRYVGVDQDRTLLAGARAAFPEDQVEFHQADAGALPFADGQFDFVFARYLLVHLPEPRRAIAEMRRVTRPGGKVFAMEPDLGFHAVHPPHPEFERAVQVWKELFPQALLGRQLAALFREAGVTRAEVDAALPLDAGGGAFRQVFRMAFEGVADSPRRRELMADDEYAGVLAALRRLEDDPATLVLGNPVIAVWGEV